MSLYISIYVFIHGGTMFVFCSEYLLFSVMEDDEEN